MAKQWKCTVCGYIHAGDDPPETCPVCGADRSKFIQVEAEKTGLLKSMAVAFKLHPVAAHFPNGLIPTAALFLLLSAVLGDPALESAAFWLIVIVTMVVPISLGSGLHDWLKSFNGRRAPIFFKKVGLALLLLALGGAAISLRFQHPDLLTHASWAGLLYVFCLVGMLACVTLLGHYGSVLVFQGVPDKSQQDTPVQGPASDDWAARIVALAPDAILAADASGIIRLWNHGAERIFGVPTSLAIGQSLDLIIPDGLRKRHWEGWARVMRSGESRYGEEIMRVPAIRSDGRRLSVEFSIVMLKGSEGQVTGVAAILRDVSEH